MPLRVRHWSRHYKVCISMSSLEQSFVGCEIHKRAELDLLVVLWRLVASLSSKANIYMPLSIRLPASFPSFYCPFLSFLLPPSFSVLTLSLPSLLSRQDQSSSSRPLHASALSSFHCKHSDRVLRLPPASPPLCWASDSSDQHRLRTSQLS